MKADVERIRGVGNLCLRDVHSRSRVGVQSPVVDGADNTDDLPFRLVGELAHDPPTDYETVFQGITIGPELTGHRLIDHDSRGGQGIVAFSEHSATSNRNLEHLEESR